MNINEKKQIKEYLLDYLKLQDPNFKFIGSKNLFICPKCKSSEPTANFYPNSKTKLQCFNPECTFSGDIFDLIKILKPNFIKKDDSDIASYLKHVLKIKIKDDTKTLLDMYKNSGFALIPISPNSKIPIKEAKGWEKTCHKNPTIWKDWLERGYNIGLNLGKDSNAIAIDIDSDETYEKVKNLLGKTLTQTTKRGKHFIYNYDSDFDSINHANLRSKGYEMELRANNAYVVVAPSSVEGENRTWNNEKIMDIPKELKTFILELIKTTKKEMSNSDYIQNAIDKNDLGIKNGLTGLNGECSDAFIKLGGVLRKKLNKDQTHYAVQMFNGLLADPIPNKNIYAMMQQLEKYRTYDKVELAKIVLDRLDIIEEGTAFQIASSLRYETKEIEEVLKYLEDENKIINIGNRKYRRLKQIEWEQDFTNLGIPVDFEVPYFHKYGYFDKGNMIIIGGKTGEGKTHITGNILKKLIDQKIHPYLISTEAGSKIGKICKQLGIKKGNFSFKTVKHPTEVELKDDVVTIIDWLKPKGGDYAKTDSTFSDLNDQLVKHGGFLIIFVQIRKNGEFFAPDQIDFYSALVAKYCYKRDGDQIDNNNTYFQTTKIRDSRTGIQYITIPTKFDSETKRLELTNE